MTPEEFQNAALLLRPIVHTQDTCTGKRGHIVADTLLLMMFLGLRKLGNICCGHKMFQNNIRNTFCVPDTKFVSATNVARPGKRGNICVRNNVSSFARALIRHENGAFRKHSSNRRILKTLALRFCVDRKHFENRVFSKTMTSR